MFEIRKSQIDGCGLFADRMIRKGEVVVRWANTIELTVGEYGKLSSNDLKFIDMQGDKIFLVGEPERYINHSCCPNTVFGQDAGAACDIASRDIESGEEITSDYGQFYNPNRSFICNCQSTNCRKQIIGGDYSRSVIRN